MQCLQARATDILLLFTHTISRALTFRNNVTDCDENKPYDQGN